MCNIIGQGTDHGRLGDDVLNAIVICLRVVVRSSGYLGCGTGVIGNDESITIRGLMVEIKHLVVRRRPSLPSKSPCHCEFGRRDCALYNCTPLLLTGIAKWTWGCMGGMIFFFLECPDTT